jgi:hypothetical protein
MKDYFGLPNPGVCDIQIFRPMGNTTSWAQWNKPKGANMIYIMAVGSGGGGGGGFSRASAADGAGGGGGGTGALTRIMTPAIMVPDVLYVQPALGGLGGAAGTAGGAGSISYVSMGPYPAGSTANFTVDNNLFVMSNAAGAGGGGGGTGTTAGAAGTAGTISVIGSQNRGGYAMFWAATVGLVGFIGGAVADGAGANATNVLSDGVPFSGGAGGSGSTGANVAGGQVTGAGFFQTIPGGTGTGVAINGGGGYSWSQSSQLFLASTGGSGGAAVDAAQAGNGGKGGFPGSGGGGGGAGTTGGRGGDGGDGVVIIISW